MIAMLKKLIIEDYKCVGAIFDGSASITYLIYPELAQLNDDWLDKMCELHKISIVVVYIPANKWNDDLTPWAELGEAPGCPPFAGKAKEFLSTLLKQIIPGVEQKFELSSNLTRDLMGVSLGGLFTLWQWMDCEVFHNIACLSGSFWYIGFLKWFESQQIPPKTGKAFFLLGEDEPHSHVKAFDSVGKNTEEIVEKLKNSGIKVDFKWVPGNHFSQPVHRAELALNFLYNCD